MTSALISERSPVAVHVAVYTVSPWLAENVVHMAPMGLKLDVSQFATAADHVTVAVVEPAFMFVDVNDTTG